MAQDATHVRVGLAGKVYSAPLLTAVPIDVSTVWAAGWLDHGFTTDDGVGFTDARTYFVVKPWGNVATPVRRVVTARDMQIKFTLLQSSAGNDILVHGGGVWAGAGAAFAFTPRTDGSADNRMFALEWTDGAAITERFIVTVGCVIAVAEVIVNGKQELKYQLTIAVDSWLRQSNDPAKAPAMSAGGAPDVTLTDAQTEQPPFAVNESPTTTTARRAA